MSEPSLGEWAGDTFSWYKLQQLCEFSRLGQKPNQPQLPLRSHRWQKLTFPHECCHGTPGDLVHNICSNIRTQLPWKAPRTFIHSMRENNDQSVCQVFKITSRQGWDVFHSLEYSSFSLAPFYCLFCSLGIYKVQTLRYSHMPQGHVSMKTKPKKSIESLPEGFVWVHVAQRQQLVIQWQYLYECFTCLSTWRFTKNDRVALAITISTYLNRTVLCSRHFVARSVSRSI